MTRVRQLTTIAAALAFAAHAWADKAAEEANIARMTAALLQQSHFSARHPNGDVSVANVISYRKAKAVTVEVPGAGRITGDVAWGGNWFFLVGEHGCELTRANVEALTDFSWRIRQALNVQGFPEVDHIELFGPPQTPGGHSRNFVLCPGKAYDRSPCGTGTSAKLACLAADGKLAEGEPWVQESILGSRFTGSYRWHHRGRGEILPVITGTAYINATATLLLDEADPFCWGIH